MSEYKPSMNRVSSIYPAICAKLGEDCGASAGGGLPAVYVEHASSVSGNLSDFASVRSTDIGYGPQPFAKVVNNTVYGNDGTASSFPEANNEPNDTLFNAIDTRQGVQHTPASYVSTALLGDSVNFRDAVEQDVEQLVAVAFDQLASGSAGDFDRQRHYCLQTGLGQARQAGLP